MTGPPCFSSQLERNEASPPLRAPRRAGEEPELLPPPTGRSLAGPEGIQRCFGRNSALLGGIQGYFWRIGRHLGRNTLILGFGGTLGEFQGISGGKDCSREGHSTTLTFSLSFQTRGNPKQSQEGGDVPAQKKRVRQVFGGLSLPSFLPLKQPQPPPLTLLPFPAAKPPREPGAVPLPQLLADRKSVRWDEEERDEAEEPRRAQGPAGGSERVGHPGEMQDTDVLAGFCQRLLFPPDTGVLPAPPNTSSLPPEFLSQLRSCRRSCKSLRSAPNLPSPTLPLPLATALGVLECCRSPLR